MRRALGTSVLAERRFRSPHHAPAPYVGREYRFGAAPCSAIFLGGVLVLHRFSCAERRLAFRARRRRSIRGVPRNPLHRMSPRHLGAQTTSRPWPMAQALRMRAMRTSRMAASGTRQAISVETMNSSPSWL